MPDQKVGELNGKWSILFRALMAVMALMLPFLISMAVWSTVTLFNLQKDIAVMKSNYKHMVDDFKEIVIDVKELKKKLE
ncbi:MAG: hypothetical protein ACW991_10560 [Candidatus Hodarchaeales archaeon]|jgi:hypothetical protein